MKKLMLLLLCGCMLLALSACDSLSFLDELDNNDDPTTSTEDTDSTDGDSTGIEKEELATKYESATTYTNTYLGVTCTVPAGWWLYHVNEDNFDASAALTEDVSLLDVYIGSDFSSIYLIELGNLQYSSKSTHLGIDISAEMADDIDNLDDYMLYYEDYMLAPYEEDTYELVESEVVTIGGVDYEKRVIEVFYEGESHYMLVTFTCEVDNGYFLSITSSYWPEHTAAIEDTTSFIEKAIVIG